MSDPVVENAEALVNAAIVATILPQMTYLVDQLLSLEGQPIPKELKLQARKLLPAWCDNSFAK